MQYGLESSIKWRKRLALCYYKPKSAKGGQKSPDTLTPCRVWISGLWNCKRTNLYCVKAPSLSSFAPAALGNKTVRDLRSKVQDGVRSVGGDPRWENMNQLESALHQQGPGLALQSCTSTNKSGCFT